MNSKKNTPCPQCDNPCNIVTEDAIKKIWCSFCGCKERVRIAFKIGKE